MIVIVIPYTQAINQNYLYPFQEEYLPMHIRNIAECIAHSMPVPITKYLNCKNQIINVRNESGICLFWYRNYDRRLQELSHILINKPHGQPDQQVTWEQNIDQDYVCVCASQSTDLVQRLNQNLLQRTPGNTYTDPDFPNGRLHRETTSCQFRSRFDYLYRYQQQAIIFDEIRGRIYLTILYQDDVGRHYR